MKSKPKSTIIAMEITEKERNLLQKKRDKEKRIEIIKAKKRKTLNSKTIIKKLKSKRSSSRATDALCNRICERDAYNEGVEAGVAKINRDFNEGLINFRPAY